MLRMHTERQTSCRKREVGGLGEKDKGIKKKGARKRKKKKGCELPCGESNPGHGGESAGS